MSGQKRPGTLANVVLGGIAVALIVWFVGGLAWSIGHISFGVIAALVLGMAVVDYVQTLRNPD